MMLTDFLTTVWANIAGLFTAPTERLYWTHIVVAALMALLVLARSGRQLSELWSSKVWLHRSALVDYRFVLLDRGVVMIAVAGTFASTAGIGILVTNALANFAPAGFLDAGPATVFLLGVGVVVAYDFAVFYSHYLFHVIPVLWEFHKVHHSAEVLTPVTAMRFHPFDKIMTATAGALFCGVFIGVTSWMFGTEVRSGMYAAVSIGLTLFFLLGHNLRHSHIWLDYPAPLGALLISPAQHQIHHSKEPRHWDRNLGFILSVWDRWFGTLYVPQEREEFECGLAENEEREFQSVTALYFLPLKKAWKLVTARDQPATNSTETSR